MLQWLGVCYYLWGIILALGGTILVWGATAPECSPWHWSCYRLFGNFFEVSDPKLRSGDRSTKIILWRFYLSPFRVQISFLTFNFCELLYKQSNELQIIVASDANREYNNKCPSYHCVCSEVPKFFLIKIADIPTNNTNIVNYGLQKKLNCQYLLVSNNIWAHYFISRSIFFSNYCVFYRHNLNEDKRKFNEDI